jgi:steroid delta-isomerase-like uncharacterized protein
MGHGDTHRLIHEAFNRRDFGAVVERLAPGFVYEEMPRGLSLKTVPEIEAWLQGWVDALSDGQVTEPSYLEGPDHSVATYHARGTNDGPFAGLPATGRTIDVPFCEVLHYASDGRVLKAEFYYDMATMLGQLGLLPGAAAVPGELETAVREMFGLLDVMDLPALQDRFDPEPQGVDEISRSWLRGGARMSDYVRQMAGAVTEVRSELNDLHETLWGDTGLVTCWLEQDYTLEGERQHVSAPTSVVLRRHPDRWRVALIHTVPLPEAG